jgi:2-polyprenyl-3-methyl-5-hydroxy-6-metoxy-1,4-benzoquinol methylase
VERAEWLRKMRAHAEALYDHLAPAYWVEFGLYANATHREFLDRLLGRLEAGTMVLDAACGAGRYDGILLEAGHDALGIDQSGRMLARAREHFPKARFPGLRYAKMGLQEMDFDGEFDGAICIDAMEHVPPEDWPGILARFQKAVRPGGVLYMTVEVAEPEEIRAAYERAQALGLPVVSGEVVDEVDVSCTGAAAGEGQAIAGDEGNPAVYHYYPPLEQVRAWFEGAGLTIEEEGMGDGYAHFLARKSAGVQQLEEHTR